MKKLLTIKSTKSSFDLLPKIPMRMRITSILLAGFLCHANAETSYSQSARISIEMNNATIEEVLNEIEAKSDFYFLYNNKLINVDRRVSVDINAENIDTILQNLFKGTDVVYQIADKQIVLSQKNMANSTSTNQQSNIIKGTVIDQSGTPIIGANVVVKGTTNGTITDMDGNFSLEAEAGSILEVTYVGYISQEIKIGNNKNLSIAMKEDSEALDELVVVGYGSQKKVNLTGSVATINLAEETMSRPVTTISSALSGMAAGLNVMQTTAKPNSEGASVQIRGVGTLNDASPLILVDGMEMSLNEINPNDVESISVLKDAASCAIYGNRAANGVILVTTKKGKDGKVNVTYSGKFSYNTPAKLIDRISNYADYMEIMNETSLNTGQAAIFNQSTIDQWREAAKNPNAIFESGYPNYVAYPNTDWYDEVYNPKWMQEHSLTVSGAEKKTTYNLSATYLNNPGLVIESGMKKYYLRGDVESRPTTFLTVGMRLWGYHTDQERNSVDDLNGLNMQKTTPGTYPYYDGYYGVAEATEEDPQTWNPVQSLTASQGSYSQTKVFANPYVKVDFLKYFSLSTNLYYDKWENEHLWHNSEYLPSYSFQKNELRNNPPSSEQLADYSSKLWRQQDQSWKTTTILNYNQTIKKDHEVSAMIGYEEYRKWGRVFDISKKGMSDTSMTDFDALTDPDYITGNTNTNFSSRSLFARANYAYKSKYLFEANIRYDGSSRFAPESRWGVFPSFSAGWRASEENFLKDLNIFDNLKLRASWGKLGNNAIDNFEWQSVYNTAIYAFGGNKTLGLAMSSFSNYALQWETTAVTNVGLDATVLNGRLSGTIEAYNKFTNGILYKPTLSPTLGLFGAPRQNIAEVTNRGVELSLSWQDHVSDFSYSISGNFSYNKNWVSKYKGELIREWRTDENGNKYYYTNLGDVSTGGDERILEGHMMNEFYMIDLYKGNGSHFNSDGSVNPTGGPKDGMIRTEDDMKWLQAMFDAGYQFYPKQGVGKDKIWYGDIIYADRDGDGVYGDDDDREFQKFSKTPKFYYGLQAYFNWKGFDLSMNWAGAAGFKIYWYDTTQNSSICIYGYNMSKELAYDHYFYDPENPNNPHTNTTSDNPRFVMDQGGQVSAAGVHRLQNGNYMKLKNLTIGYSLPKYIANKIYMQNVRFYVSGENLLTITGFDGMDPEMMSGNGYAPMRQYALGVNVTF